jgi:hypothetical protein
MVIFRNIWVFITSEKKLSQVFSVFIKSLKPDFNYLGAKKKIFNSTQLSQSLFDLAANTDLKKKSRDFEHLVFYKENTKKILLFKDFIASRFQGEQE